MALEEPLRRVEVAVRVRPLGRGNTASSLPHSSSGTCVSLDARRGTITVEDDSGRYAASSVQTHTYKQDLLFDEHSTNKELFEKLVLGKMSEATEEKPDTLCFLAYGHTSSGKTHSIAGSEGEPGILTLCVEELLRRDGLVEVSMLEVYIDKVYDLLSNSAARRVRRRQGPHGPTIVVEELTTCSLVSLKQWEAVAAYGMRSRRTAATERNARSSRSHAIFTVKSRGVRLCLVDLAGSERQTVFSPQLNQESIAINKSLSRLSTVLEALSQQRVREDGSRSYVNFRDTTLTVLLQRYLSGASLTTFLACVHPASEHYQETLSTLRYTQRLKRIKTSVVRVGGPGDVSAMAPYLGAEEHQALLDELTRLRTQVREKDRSSRLVEEAQRQRIAELEASLAERAEHTTAPTAGPSPQYAHTDSVRAQRARDTRRVAGWLLSRVLGDMPMLNVGYDDYFDGFIPAPLQVIGYVSTMACLPPQPAGSEPALAFLDVGDLSMGLSMLDAGIPPMVRLHRVPCTDPSAWEAHEWEGAGCGVYVLCFFATNDESVLTASESGDAHLACCGGCVSAEALLPVATVLCVPSRTPAAVKEEVLQWLVALQGEQEEACGRQDGGTGPMTSFDGSVDAYLEGSLKRGVDEADPSAAVVEQPHPLGSPTLTSSSSSSVGEALAREVARQSREVSKIDIPFRDVSTSSPPSSDNAVPVAPATKGRHSPESEVPAAAVTAPDEVHVQLKERSEPAHPTTCVDGASGGTRLHRESPPATPEEQAPAPAPPAAAIHRGKKHRKGKGNANEGGGDEDRAVKFESCHGCAVV